MNRRRLLAAAFLSAVIVAVLGLIVYTEHVNASETIAVWVLTHDVAGGAQYASGDVQSVEVHAQSGDFNYARQSPMEYQARYARNLSVGDILRVDDLVPATAESEVAITVQDPPPLAPGDRIDVFATYAGDEEALIGRDIQVETVAAGALTILVATSDEQAWVAVGSSNVALHVARAVPGSQVDGPPITASDAIRILCGAACGAGSSAAP